MSRAADAAVGIILAFGLLTFIAPGPFERLVWTVRCYRAYRRITRYGAGGFTRRLCWFLACTSAEVEDENCTKYGHPWGEPDEAALSELECWTDDEGGAA